MVRNTVVLGCEVVLAISHGLAPEANAPIITPRWNGVNSFLGVIFEEIGVNGVRWRSILYDEFVVFYA